MRADGENQFVHERLQVSLARHHNTHAEDPSIHAGSLSCANPQLLGQTRILPNAGSRRLDRCHVLTGGMRTEFC
jgi:hypothetical protein